MFPIDFKQNKDILVHTIEEYTSLISICFFSQTLKFLSTQLDVEFQKLSYEWTYEFTEFSHPIRQVLVQLCSRHKRWTFLPLYKWSMLCHRWCTRTLWRKLNFISQTWDLPSSTKSAPNLNALPSELMF